MSVRQPFPPPLLATIRSKSSLKVRAGQAGHRFLGIWAVVVERRATTLELIPLPADRPRRN